MDKISPVRRSENMRAIRSKDTSPEWVVRRIAHRCGFRYRLHRRDLPGKPDLVFSSRKAVIFVHGCFWHLHGCPGVRVPKSNLGYWQTKLERNSQRDKKHFQTLLALGWNVLVVWECETKNSKTLEDRIKSFLSLALRSTRQSQTI